MAPSPMDMPLLSIERVPRKRNTDLQNLVEMPTRHGYVTTRCQAPLVQ